MRQVFFIKASEDEGFTWKNIDLGREIAYHSGRKHKQDIGKIQLHDIVIGYSSDRIKAIECLGRIISAGFFGSVDGDRFLIQKVVDLQKSIPWKRAGEVIPRMTRLNERISAIIKLEPEEWLNLKKELTEQKDIAGIVARLEKGWNDISIE